MNTDADPERTILPAAPGPNAMQEPAPPTSLAGAPLRPPLRVVTDTAAAAGPQHLIDEDERVTVMAGALADAVDAKGRYYPSHCRAVSRLAQAIGAQLGIRGQQLFQLATAGLLHDVGKLHVPDSILNKPSRLTIAEYDAIKHHPVHGHQLLVSLGLTDEAKWVLHHHERADGLGYPSGLTGDAVPLGSRILLVADTFDCLTTTRVYRKATPPRDALHEIHANVGTQFDHTVVGALERAIAQ